MADFRVYKDRVGEYRWYFRAGNGETLSVSSEGYRAKASCLHAIALVKRDAATAPVYDDTGETQAYSHTR